MTDEIVEVEPLEGPSDTELVSVVDLAREQVRLEREVSKLERELSEAKVRLSTIRDDRLPLAMTTLGLSDYSLGSGYGVEVKEHYQCGQLDDAPDEEGKRPLSERIEALSWLDDNGHGDIARRVVTITLGAKSLETAQELIDLVRCHPAANSFRVEQRRVVPWNTLAKFTREQIEGGENPPSELLGVQVRISAKITKPKKQETFL
jgi:hypothetical protein